MYHPCHKLSVPSAKLFWCRHCMQMFEDAITRWKHSRTCKGSRKVTDDKDLNGQVIQLYVKADKVSYQENNIPGQGFVKYKPHIKKKSAELKCLICQNRFLSLDEIREHVKYPCRRAYYRAGDPLEGDEGESGLDSNKDPTVIKIRRVEFAPSKDTEVSTSESGLSVLAEASKHIESLVTGPNWYTSEAVNSNGVVTESTTKKTPDPLLIQFQQEDGSILPADQLDQDIVASTIRDTAASLPVGQEIQLQLKVDKIQNYVKTSSGNVIAIHSFKPAAEIGNSQSIFTTAKEVQETLVNTAHQVSSLESITPSTLQFAPVKGPATSLATAETQTLPSIPNLYRPCLQDLLQRPQDTIRPVQFLDTDSGVTYLDSGSIVSTSLPVVNTKQDLVLEETVEEQGFLLPTEDHTYL